MNYKFFSKNIFICRNKNPCKICNYAISQGINICISITKTTSATNNASHLFYKSIAKKNILFYHSFHAFIISYSTSQQ